MCCKHFSINVGKGLVLNHVLQSELFVRASQSQDTVSSAVKELQIWGSLFAENLGESSELNTQQETLSFVCDIGTQHILTKVLYGFPQSLR